MKRVGLGALASAMIIALVQPAAAHASLEVKEAKVGSGYKAVINVPHGCEGQSTTEVSIDIPEGVIAVKPMPKAGWKLSLEKGAYARTYDFYHGAKKSEGVKRVTWSGGDLPDEYFDQFVLSAFVAGELKPGTKLAFPVTQKCPKGELKWNEVAAEGVDPHSLEHPAPQLLLVAGGDDDHHHHAQSGDVKANGIALAGPWTRPASAGGMGVGYVKITNEGSAPDVLLGASSDIAERVELHETTISADGVASMKPVKQVDIAPGQSVELKPGGLHIMLIGLKEAIKDGPVKLKLNLQKAGAINVDLAVRTSAPAAGEDEHKHKHHQH